VHNASPLSTLIAEQSASTHIMATTKEHMKIADLRESPDKQETKEMLIVRVLLVMMM